MPMLLDRDVERVAIVDDEAEVREAFTWQVEDADFDAVPQRDPLPRDVEEAAIHLAASADAAICDHRLRTRNYAIFNGAELAASLYEKRVPVVFITRWERPDLEEIRQYRDRIPVMLRPQQLTVSELVQGLEYGISELDRGFSPERRPWRTQVHVLEVASDRRTFSVELPAWHSDDVVRLRTEDVPAKIAGLLVDGFRCHARVNIGAISPDDLYFTEWEAR